MAATNATCRPERGGETGFRHAQGTFTAVGGAADGLTSTDIGVAENGTEPVGESLQLVVRR